MATFRENVTRRFSISSVFMTVIVAQFLILQIGIIIQEGNCQFYENYAEEDNFDLVEDFSLDDDDTNQASVTESGDIDENEIIRAQNNQDKFTDSNKDYLLRYDKHAHTWFQRKITVPNGTQLSLTTQVSRPDIAPGFFYDVDGIIVDAVVEIPIWMSVNKFLKAAYENKVNVVDGSDTDKKSYAGYERCFLYEKLETYISSFMEMPPLISHMCLLRAICEAQSIAVYHPLPPTNVVFELIHLFLTPSLGAQDECYEPYLAAELIGIESGQCTKYAAFCPLNLGGIMLSNFFPPDDYQ